MAAVVDPGILLGVALLWTFLQTKIFLPIYGTIYLLMVAMVIKSMPFGTQMIKSVYCNSVMILRKLQRSAVELGSIPFGGSFSIDHAGAHHRRSGRFISAAGISARSSCSVLENRGRCRC